MKAILNIRYAKDGKVHDVRYDLGDLNANEYTLNEHHKEVERSRFHWNYPITRGIDGLNDAISIWYSIEANAEERRQLFEKGILLDHRIPKERHNQT